MRHKVFARCLAALSLSCCVNAVAGEALADPIKHYISEMESRYHFNKQELATLFKAAHINQEIIDRMNRPYEAKPWPTYRKFFINQQRISKGVAFWHEHQDVLAEAEQKYGVPASVIIAIIGVETQYGSYTGNFPVLDALTTLSFYYPARADFFKSELTEFLLMTREQKLDPLKLTGSYAGAIGYPQFMPSNYRRFAVDHSNRGSADLVHDPRDAILSVANFLSKKGWEANQPVATNLPVKRPIDEQWLSNNAKPTATLATLKAKGIIHSHPADADTPTAIVKLQAENALGADYWLTFGNFRAIMHYNPRVNYAMAVYQLSEEIKHAYQQSITARAKTPSTRSAARRTA